MSVIKNTSIYLGVSVFQSLMSFCLLPVYTGLLTKAEFGLASVINSVAGLLGIFFLFGTQSVISRLYFEYKEDPKQLKSFLGTIFLSKLLWNIFIAIILVLGKDIIFPLIAQDVNFYPFLVIAIAIGFFDTIFVSYQTLQQTKQEGMKYAITQCIYLVLNNGITVFLLLIFKMQAEGIVLGTLIALVIMTIFVFYQLRTQIRFNIDKKILRVAFTFSWPILFHALFTWSLSSVNKLLLNNLLSTEVVAVYSVGFVIAGIVSMVTVALNKSYTPWFFQQMKKESSDYSEVVRFAEFIVIIYSIVALGISLFGFDIISLLVNKGYGDAWQVVPFLSFAYVLNGIYFFFINIFNYKKEAVKYIPLFSFLSAIVNISLNYILIPQFGMIGSALATLISMLLLSLTTYFGSRKFVSVGYNYIKMITPVVITFAMSLVLYLNFNLSFWIMVLVKIVYMLLCIGILYLIYRKRFGENIQKQIANFKTYIDGIKTGALNFKRDRK